MPVLFFLFFPFSHILLPKIETTMVLTYPGSRPGKGENMSDLRKQNALFVARGGQEIEITRGSLAIMPLKINSNYRTDLISTFNPNTGVNTAKVSNAAVLLDKLFVNKTVSVYASEDGTVYSEIDGKSAMRMPDGTVYYDESMSPRRFLYADILWEAVNGTNEELKNALGTVKIAYDAGDEKRLCDAVLWFCDSYYFGCDGKNGWIGLNQVDQTEMEAMFRSKGFSSEIPFISELDLEGPTGKYDDVAIKAAPKAADTSDLASGVLEECKAGKYQVDFTWTEDQAPFIQNRALLDGFVPNETFTALVKKIKFRTDRVLARMKKAGEAWNDDRPGMIGKDYINCTLVGKPGTGKTALAYALSAATGMPVYTNNCSHNTDEDEFEGKVKLVDGKPESVPTDGLNCFENGGIYLLEEVNLPQAAVIMGALGQAVEFPFILKKNGYETIRRHPLCIFISTMNTGTAGSKQLSQPFANRFKQSFMLNDPDKNDFISILQTTGATKKVCSWVYKAYETITETIANDNAMADVESILLTLSMRSCMGAIENIQEGMSPKDAIRTSIIGKIAETDMEVAKNCEAVLDAMKDMK